MAPDGSAPTRSGKRRLPGFVLSGKRQDRKDCDGLLPAGADGFPRFPLRYVGGRTDVELSLLTQAQASGLGSDECPVSMERFEDCEVDFMQGERFLQCQPDLCAGMLPCGHVFGLIPLVYHMLVGDMRCPVCRGGHCRPLQARCLPLHLRARLSSRVKEMRDNERREQEEQDREYASMIMIGSMEDEIHASMIEGILRSTHVRMSVYFYAPWPGGGGGQDTMRTVYSLEYALQTTDHMRYTLDAAGVEHLVSSVNTHAPGRLRLTVHTTSLDHEPLCLSNTPMFIVDPLRGACVEEDSLALTVPGTSESEFVLTRHRASQRNGGGGAPNDVAFHALSWRSSVHIIQRLLLRF